VLRDPIRGGLDDLARAILRTTDKLVVLALAADHVLDGIVLNPHCRTWAERVDAASAARPRGRHRTTSPRNASLSVVCLEGRKRRAPHQA